MRELILTTAALLCLAAAGNATAWDVQAPDGSWGKNPECTGSCEVARSDALQGHKPDRPKGDKPQREKPKADRPAPERPSTAKPATRGSWCIAPTGQIARVDGAKGNPPPRNTLHACGPFIHRKGGKVGEW